MTVDLSVVHFDFFAQVGPYLGFFGGIVAVFGTIASIYMSVVGLRRGKKEHDIAISRYGRELDETAIQECMYELEQYAFGLLRNLQAIGEADHSSGIKLKDPKNRNERIAMLRLVDKGRITIDEGDFFWRVPRELVTFLEPRNV